MFRTFVGWFLYFREPKPLYEIGSPLVWRDWSTSSVRVPLKCFRDPLSRVFETGPGLFGKRKRTKMVGWGPRTGHKSSNRRWGGSGIPGGAFRPTLSRIPQGVVRKVMTRSNSFPVSHYFHVLRSWLSWVGCTRCRVWGVFGLGHLSNLGVKCLFS